MPKFLLDFSDDKEWTGKWLVLDNAGKELCKVTAKTYDAALNKARNRPETAGIPFMVIKEEKPKDG